MRRGRSGKCACASHNQPLASTTYIRGCILMCVSVSVCCLHHALRLSSSSLSLASWKHRMRTYYSLIGIWLGQQRACSSLRATLFVAEYATLVTQLSYFLARRELPSSRSIRVSSYSFLYAGKSTIRYDKKIAYACKHRATAGSLFSSIGKTARTAVFNMRMPN